MYRRFALAIGVLVAAAILAFVAAPLHAQNDLPRGTAKLLRRRERSGLHRISGSPPGSVGVRSRRDHPNPPPPTWTRYCGRAVALVRLHGAAFRIHGGRCLTGAVIDMLVLGLHGDTPAVPAKSFTMGVTNPRHHAGAFRPWDVSIQLGGRGFDMPEEISRGTVTVRRSLRDGTFSFRLRDATSLTGSWSCD